jgi:hypothetical protein
MLLCKWVQAGHGAQLQRAWQSQGNGSEGAENSMNNTQQKYGLNYTRNKLCFKVRQLQESYGDN